MGYNSYGHFCLGPLQRQCQTGKLYSNKRPRLQNAKNTMTSKAIATFNQLQLRPLVCMATPPPPFLNGHTKNLLICLVTPGSTSGFTSACPWLWSVEMLPNYWPVCNFDLILSVRFLVAYSLTSIIVRHLPLYQCIAECLPNPHSLCKLHCPLCCAVFLCVLV